MTCELLSVHMQAATPLVYVNRMFYPHTRFCGSTHVHVSWNVMGKEVKWYRNDNKRELEVVVRERKVTTMRGETRERRQIARGTNKRAKMKGNSGRNKTGWTEWHGITEKLLHIQTGGFVYKIAYIDCVHAKGILSPLYTTHLVKSSDYAGHPDESLLEKAFTHCQLQDVSTVHCRYPLQNQPS